MIRMIAASAIFALSTSGAAAAYYMYCDEPDPPYCADGYSQFSSQSEFDSCLSDMEQYEDDVNDYTECLASNSREAIDEYNDTVRDFNYQAGS